MMILRAMDLDDVPQVCAVDAQCVPLPWSPETFQQELSGTVGYYRVAELDGRVVGYLGAHVVLDEAHIVTVGVDPKVRRRGIGERLLADALRYALANGCHRVTLEVRERNDAAQRLYRKYGFSPISRRPRYYTDNGEDAIVMWIEDATRPGFRALFAERLANLEQDKEPE
ncbi:MAG: ribosomal protein S18-alanine N-acetyltransferase [Actinomycetota bacterium]